MTTKRKAIGDSSKTIVSNKKVCSVGVCGKVDEYNLCRYRRPPGVIINKLDLNPTRNNEGVTEFKRMGSRFFSFPFLQENPKFDKIKLLDVSIKLNLTSYHAKEITETINVPEEITKLLSPFKIDLYLVRICDLELSKKKKLDLSDILKNPNIIQDHQLKDKIDILMHHPVVISCSSDCLFQSHEITMCREFDKNEQNVCVLSRNTDENIVYDTANYRFMMIIDYMDFLYQSKLLNTDLSEERKLELGDKYNINNGNSGIPVFFTSGIIEIAFAPDIKEYQTIEAMTDMMSDRILEKFQALQKKDDNE